MKRVIVTFKLLFLITVSFGTLWAAEISHTPCVSAVTSNSARIVVKTNKKAEVQISYNSTLTDAVSTDKDYDFFVIIDLTGLQPNTIYTYFPVVDGINQTDYTGSFKTFPEDGTATTFSFLTGSGQQSLYDDENSGIGDMFPDMAKEDALFLLHQGDWFYPDTTDSEQGDSTNYFPLHEDLIWGSYKTRYDPDFPMSELLKVMPVDYTYDDHDWINDNSDGSYMTLGGSNTIAAYRQAFPNYPLPGASNGIWHKFTCGNADIFVVDNRAQRDPNINALYWHPLLSRWVFVANYQDDHSILGDEQMDWLIDELKNSTATWKFISSGTPWNPAGRGLIEIALLLQGTSYDPFINPATGEPTTMEFLAQEFSDKWAGFPESIYKLLTAISDNSIENVIFLSGDTHNSGIDDGTNSILPEMMAGGLDRSNSQIIAISKAMFKYDIWNQGGHTYDNAIPPDLGNAYGKVTVNGDESVTLEIVSETKNVLASHTVYPGFLPRRVAGSIAPGGIDFGMVPLGSVGTSAVVAISTGIDNFEITNITVTNLTGQSSIIPAQTTANLASGEAKMIGFAFIPNGADGDITQALITIECNDGGFKYLFAQGVIGDPCSIDDEPPVITVIADPIILWPPNHKYQTFDLYDFVISVSDNCATDLTIDDVVIKSVSSDEPENSVGDGNTMNDMVIAEDCKSIQLRKERQAGGNGRVYTIYFELDDDSDNTAYANCQVHVPNNNGEKAIDDGPVYEVFGDCDDNKSLFTTANDNDNIELTVYPNPFNNSITITYELKYTSTVQVIIYNHLGKQLEVIEQNQTQGKQKIIWNAEGLPAGVYFCVLKTESGMQTMRMIKLK